VGELDRMENIEKSGPVILLECTLRDGSYSIDYQFSADETRNISKALADAGFKLIEVGHGLGFGGSDGGFGKAKETDFDYVSAGADGVSETGSLIGYFFIPGLGNISDIKKARDVGLGFIRVGTNVSEFDQAKEAIVESKKCGLITCGNLMKSYAVSARKFGEICADIESYGADMISLVDSAGGMLPHEVEKYCASALDKINVPLGFHGHNNFQLAAANCISARNAGARVLDVSIRGMGRSAGNAQTEIMVAIMEKLGEATGIDLIKTMDIGEKFIAPLMPSQKGVDDVAVAVGLGRFHSSFLPRVKMAADETGVDLRELIMRVGEEDVVNPENELIMELAREMQRRPRTFRYPHMVKFDDDGDEK